MRTLRKWQEYIHDWAKRKGWWDEDAIAQRPIAAQIALMHSELSEALEAERMGMPHIYFIGDKPEGLGIELADCVIRIMDSCQRLDIDLEKCISTKMGYNETRSYRHGGKII